MHRKLLTPLAFAAILLAGCLVQDPNDPGTDPQPNPNPTAGYATIQGTVRTYGNTAIGNAQVTLSIQDPSNTNQYRCGDMLEKTSRQGDAIACVMAVETRTTTTDIRGNFSFDSVPDGSHWIDVWAYGFQGGYASADIQESKDIKVAITLDTAEVVPTCLNDAMCGEGYTCDTYNYCEAPPSNCGPNQDCATIDMCFGRCVVAPPVGGCNYDDQCGADSYCSLNYDYIAYDMTTVDTTYIPSDTFEVIYPEPIYSGTCKPKPEGFCRGDYECGTDEQCYYPPTFAYTDHGFCQPKPAECLDHTGCSADEHCEWPDYSAYDLTMKVDTTLSIMPIMPEPYVTTGTCWPGAPQPVICTKELNLVCGANGITYGNPCMAGAAGSAVAYYGSCEAIPTIKVDRYGPALTEPIR